MYYKRDEAFRYTFGTPLPAKLELEENTEQSIDVQIIDISPNGTKIETKEKFPLTTDAGIYLQFELSDQNFHIRGFIAWVKEQFQSTQFGVQLDSNEEWKRDLTNALKKYAKAHR